MSLQIEQPSHGRRERAHGISKRDRERVDSLSRREIGFVHNADFEILSPEQLDDDAAPSLFDSGRPRAHAEPEAGAPAPRVPARPLLTPDGETYLFRKYNYLKYRANALRSMLGHRRESVPRLDEIEHLLRDAERTREMIASANLRLVASVARRYSRSDHEFDELFAEGTLILLGAIEKFDYSRGFRFSTYATHSIQRHFFRVLKRRHQRKKKEHPAVDALHAVPDRDETPVMDEDDLSQARQLVARWDECLSEREQEILAARFGLGSSDEPRTLKSISGDVGLSKERVRQIQMRALEKLRDFAATEGLTVEL